MNNTIIIDDGSKEFIIQNKRGEEMGRFYFCPSDVGIVDRHQEALRAFETISESLKSVDIDPTGSISNDTPEFDKQFSELKNAENVMKEKFDYMFDGNVAEAFFSKRSMFTPINGVFYVENVLTAIGNVIESEIKKETDKSQKRVNKYLKGGKR